MTQHICAGCLAKQTDTEHALCPQCELDMAVSLLDMKASITPLDDMLDATVHYAGHEPSRIQPADPPTPIRLEVLDLLERIGVYAGELLNILHGDPFQQRDPDWSDAGRALQECAEDPWLGRYGIVAEYKREADRILKDAREYTTPKGLRPIGQCPNPLCGVELEADPDAGYVTCGMCGGTYRTRDIKMRTLYRLCWDEERTGTAADIARTMAACGFQVNRKTITTWAFRNKLRPAGNVGNKPLYRYSDVYRLACGTRAF